MNEDVDELPKSFLDEVRSLEHHYLQHSDPILQSGFGGGPERWRRERGIVLDAIDEDGDLLDVGCANGYLLECLAEWGRDKGVALAPFARVPIVQTSPLYVPPEWLT